MKAIVIDCAKISDREAFHTAVSLALELPSHYGRNLDALHDCLTALCIPTQICMVNFHSTEFSLGCYAIAIRRALTQAAEENRCIQIHFE